MDSLTELISSQTLSDENTLFESASTVLTPGALYNIQITPRDTINNVVTEEVGFDYVVYPCCPTPISPVYTDETATLTWTYPHPVDTIRLVVWCPAEDNARQTTYSLNYNGGAVPYQQTVTVERLYFYLYRIIAVRYDVIGIIGEGYLFSQPVFTVDPAVSVISGLPSGSITQVVYTYIVGNIANVSRTDCIPTRS